MKRAVIVAVAASVFGGPAITGLTLGLTGPRPRYYDVVHHTWVTAPQTQTISLLTSGHAA